MKITHLYFAFYIIAVTLGLQKGHIEKINELKSFKKILKTKINVLVLFVDDFESSKVKNLNSVMTDVANRVYGKGTLVTVDCSNNEGKKVCKKFKVITKDGFALQHFTNGEFHKDYDRQLTANSLETFMIDPKGDVPWYEDPTAKDVYHLRSSQDIRKLLQQGRPTLIMFYAPWCDHCKSLKPEYAKAATQLKGHSILAAMDLDKIENRPIAQALNVQGFPSLKYFNKGDYKFDYHGERTAVDLIKWVKDPQQPIEEPSPDLDLPWSETSENIEHLTSATFEAFLATWNSVLVMFYAPNCGHCKAMKPAYEAAAKRLAQSKPNAKLAAVDAIQAQHLATKYEVKGFPTLKYFEEGEFKYDFTQRQEEDIYQFMMNPTEPAPPPEPEKLWKQTESAVRHLTDDDFKASVKTKKHALVIFYAPWCGHCKAAKPAFTDAANFFEKESKVMFAAVDCTSEKNICAEYDVTGFPTIIAFKYGKDAKQYQEGRTKDAFIDFMLRELGPDFVPDNLPAQQATVPPPESWNNIKMLDDNFDIEIATMEKALVIFFAPWCGYCKKAKPEFEKAALENPDLKFVAVDCTRFKEVCTKYGVKGYPTIYPFINGVQGSKYTGDRTANAFVNALKMVKTEL